MGRAGCIPARSLGIQTVIELTCRIRQRLSQPLRCVSSMADGRRVTYEEPRVVVTTVGGDAIGDRDAASTHASDLYGRLFSSRVAQPAEPEEHRADFRHARASASRCGDMRGMA